MNAKLAIDFWVYPGKLGLTQPSLCLFHDAVQIGTPLLDALTELFGQARSARRTLTFKASTRKRALGELKLRLVPEREDLRIMNIQHDAYTGIIQMTDAGLALMTDAVASWLKGAEDFGISPRHSSLSPKQFGKLDKASGELWFWGPGYDAP
ncbi:hypothetical protein [Roseimaritima ulvae]|uniref:Uncharacterized protein n=1 Tax=Roseimaritima ulvae TaxID=980254 RepID=A0A5B9R5K9_9BACT|nr:hypothetical protein [Roseimaritima ulvae]QEG41503.1 hypothetical protein UC8_35260 [Roseimaritima ulvae]